jgi:hypothetical protein
MKGFVYKITSPSTDKIYVGSTIVSLKKRFSAHKYKQNCSSKIIISLGDAVIECIEEVEFENKNELRIRERHHIELNRDKCVNKIIPTRTRKEYKIDNADEIKEIEKQYYIDNIDRIREYSIANADRKKEYDKQYNIVNVDKRKQYLIDNADRIKAKINCECGGRYTLHNKLHHLKFKKHQNYIASII